MYTHQDFHVAIKISPYKWVFLDFFRYNLTNLYIYSNEYNNAYMYPFSGALKNSM